MQKYCSESDISENQIPKRHCSNYIGKIVIDYCYWLRTIPKGAKRLTFFSKIPRCIFWEYRTRELVIIAKAIIDYAKEKNMESKSKLELRVWLNQQKNFFRKHRRRCHRVYCPVFAIRWLSRTPFSLPYDWSLLKVD